MKTHLNKSKQNIRTQRPLMRLINHQRRIPRQIRLRQKLSQQHPIRHILQHRLVARAVLEPDRVPDLVPDLRPHLVRDARGHAKLEKIEKRKEVLRARQLEVAVAAVAAAESAHVADAGGVRNAAWPSFGVADGAFVGGFCNTNGLLLAPSAVVVAAIGWFCCANADTGSTMLLLLPAAGVKGAGPATGDSEMSDRDLNWEGGKRGERAYWEKAGDLGPGPKPGVLGADCERSCARYRSERARSRRSIDLVSFRFV